MEIEMDKLLDFITSMAWFWLVIGVVFALVHIGTTNKPGKTAKTVLLLLLITVLASWLLVA